MIFKWMMKNPMFIIGVILMGLFLTSQFREGGTGYKESLTPTSCKAVLVKLDRRIPATWSASCLGNNLNIIIQKDFMPPEKDNLEQLRVMLYNDLANDIIHIAKSSPLDNLELTEMVSIRTKHPKLEIGAMTEGRFIVKFATLENLDLIKEHLKQTVQVQEISKK